MKEIIGVQGEAKKLSKLQVKFNKLVEKVEKLKTKLKLMEDCMAYTQVYYAEHVATVAVVSLDARVRYISKLHTEFLAQKLTKKEKKTISEHITNETNDLLNTLSYHQDFDAEKVEKMKSIFRYHTDSDYDQMIQASADEHLREFKEILRHQFGDQVADSIELDTSKNPMEYMNDLMEQLKELTEGQEEAPKSKKQLEQKAADEAVEQGVQQTIKEIYNALAKEFHPDLARNDAEREQRHQIMLRITDAKERGDLLDLMRLQLEFAQLDQDKINGLADEKLKFFVAALSQQVLELESKLAFLQAPEKEGLIIHPYMEFMTNSEQKSKKKMDKWVKKHWDLIESLELDIDTLDTPKSLKSLAQFLGSGRIVLTEDDIETLFLQSLFGKG